MTDNLEFVSFIAASATAAVGIISTLLVARRDSLRSERRRLPEGQELVVGGSAGGRFAASTRRAIRTGAIIEFSAITAVALAVSENNWAMLVWSLAIVVAVPSWLLVIYAPTICGVTTRRGTSCRNVTRGVLFGCHLHTWAKFFARLGWHTQPMPQTQLTEEADGNSQLVEMRITEPGSSKVLFWLASGAVVTGVISAAIDIVNVFRRNP